MPGSDGAPARPGDASPPAVPIRLSLTLPGSASLGAYQAGAVSALAVTVNALRQRGRPVRLDAIGGASAGSIVALLFTHCLLTGRDAPAMLGRAWIDEVDIGLLRSGGGHSPLAFDDLRERMVHFLADEDRHPRRVHPPLDAPVTLQVSLTDLLGRSRAVEIGTGPTELLSYADWLEFELRPDHDAAALTDGGASTEGAAPSVLDAVLASASHPGAFPPVLVDGDRWCTDGGLVESRPVQRVVAAAQRRAGRSRATRLHLVVDPRSSGPTGGQGWEDPAADKGWIDGLRRALSILPTQALHDDLRDVLDVNRRLERLDELVDRLAPTVHDEPSRQSLRDDIASVAGLDGCERIDVDVINPLLVGRRREGETGVADLLAGDFIGAFGGFLQRDIRANDFNLGWRCTEAWIGRGLGSHRVAPADVDAVRAEVAAARPFDPAPGDLPAEGIEQLGALGRWRLALLALQFGRVLTQQALRPPMARVRHWVGAA
ncbi:MAG: patatin-like phospholipase family protein [Acidimicrobiia bacterium]